MSHVGRLAIHAFNTEQLLLMADRTAVPECQGVLRGRDLADDFVHALALQR